MPKGSTAAGPHLHYIRGLSYFGLIAALIFLESVGVRLQKRSQVLHQLLRASTNHGPIAKVDTVQSVGTSADIDLSYYFKLDMNNKADDLRLSWAQSSVDLQT